MSAVTRARHRATPSPDPRSLVGLWIATLLLSTLGWTAAQVFLPTVVGWRPVVIVSGSMLPRIQPGDVLSVQPGDRGLRVGDVVTFRNPEQPATVLTHRLSGRTADGRWLTKGDANASADPLPLPAADIIGRPRLLIGNAGLLTYWRSTGQDRKLAAALGGAGLLALLAWWVARGSGARASAPAPRPSANRSATQHRGGRHAANTDRSR